MLLGKMFSSYLDYYLPTLKVINVEQSDSSSETPDENDDSWYYSDDGKVSQIPADTICARYKKDNIRCKWNLDGAKIWRSRQKEVKKQARQDKLGFIPVPREQKCYRCAENVLACDGRYPCNRCNTKCLRRSCRPQGVETLPSCTQCIANSGKGCDRGRPCKRCIDRKFNCAYEAQDGLLSRSYQVLGAPLPQGFTTVGPLAEGESSNEECIRCQRQKLSCDGEQPCYQCIKMQGKETIANCNYRRSDGTYESWAVRPFQSNNLHGKSLREDYKKYTGRRKLKVSNELRIIRDGLTSKIKNNSQSRVDETVDNNIDEIEINARHQVAKNSLKRFKFGLSAYSEHFLPPLQLKISSSTDAKYYEAKKEELRSHEEKGTWQVVPLPEGIKPVTSR
ncbi:hypothetical protein B0J14DRAFT_562118 [Halenospora varia]|nr:hypothetical protein B0J14DRAFT_562118 [Halenospora varia]